VEDPTVHVIIAGCGRVGSQLATSLADDGHDVVIVDKDAGAFRRLGESFKGTTLKGIVFDKDTLETARVRKAKAFIAVTSGDNSNIVAARTAKERYGVDRVIARIYDPARAEIFERLGITVIASARWTAETIIRELSPPDERVETTIGPGIGDVLLYTMRAPATCHGVPYERVQLPGRSVLAAITRAGNTTVPAGAGLLEAGDLLHLAVERSALDQVRQDVELLGRVEH
jgi:trk system potassium uptake protein TrkA